MDGGATIFLAAAGATSMYYWLKNKLVADRSDSNSSSEQLSARTPACTQLTAATPKSSDAVTTPTTASRPSTAVSPAVSAESFTTTATTSRSGSYLTTTATNSLAASGTTTTGSSSVDSNTHTTTDSTSAISVSESAQTQPVASSASSPILGKAKPAPSESEASQPTLAASAASTSALSVSESAQTQPVASSASTLKSEATLVGAASASTPKSEAQTAASASTPTARFLKRVDSVYQDDALRVGRSPSFARPNRRRRGSASPVALQEARSRYLLDYLNDGQTRGPSSHLRLAATLDPRAAAPSVVFRFHPNGRTDVTLNPRPTDLQFNGAPVTLPPQPSEATT